MLYNVIKQAKVLQLRLLLLVCSLMLCLHELVESQTSHCHHGIWHPLVGFVTQSAMYSSSVIDTTNILSLEMLFIDEDGPSISAAWACHRGWTTVSKFTVLCFPDTLVIHHLWH